MVTKISKPFYSEYEAAVELGVSIEQLRSMVKNHIVKDDDMPEGGIATFHASDLLLLKLLSRAAVNSPAA
jgi:hypothetical protein